MKAAIIRPTAKPSTPAASGQRIASGTETSLNDLAATLAEVMGSDLQPEYGPERSVNAVPRRLADVRAARERLGFEAEIDLHTGLRRLVDWWRVNGDPT